jgi:hypothetical protein
MSRSIASGQTRIQDKNLLLRCFRSALGTLLSHVLVTETLPRSSCLLYPRPAVSFQVVDLYHDCSIFPSMVPFSIQLSYLLVAASASPSPNAEPIDYVNAMDGFGGIGTR